MRAIRFLGAFAVAVSLFGCAQMGGAGPESVVAIASVSGAPGGCSSFSLKDPACR